MGKSSWLTFPEDTQSNFILKKSVLYPGTVQQVNTLANTDILMLHEDTSTKTMCFAYFIHRYKF